MKMTGLVLFLGMSRLVFAASATPVATTNGTATPNASTEAAAAQPELPPSPCRMQTTADHTQTGGTCPTGEVMTGVEKVSPLTVHCAATYVRCDAPTRFLAAEPPPQPSAVPATPEKAVELLPPPPATEGKDD